MPRKALKISVELRVNRVSCPGVWLKSNNELYLSVCMFGKYQRTTLAEPVFPIIFLEKFKFEKTFYTAVDPAEVSDLLEDEDILCELVQLAPEEKGGAILLSSFEQNCREFLFPYPQLLAAYGSDDREVLMERTWEFPGIAPKIEFGSHAVIKEVKLPRSPNGLYEADLVKSSKSRRPKSPSPRTFVYPDSAEEEKSYQDPTVASITRSRSLSPAMKAKLTSTDRGRFLVRHADETLIDRVPGSPPRKSGKHRRTVSAKLTSSPRGRSCDKITSRHRTPVYNSDDDSDVEYLGFRRKYTYSNPEATILPPRRSLSPLVYKRSLRERYLDDIEDALLCRRMEQTKHSRRASSRDSLDDLADDFRRSRLYY